MVAVANTGLGGALGTYEFTLAVTSIAKRVGVRQPDRIRIKSVENCIVNLKQGLPRP
jgi:hypothetical protein